MSNITKRNVLVCSLFTALLCSTACERVAGYYSYRAGERLYFAGHYAEAIKCFDSSINHKYQLRESLAMRGLAHYKQGEYDLAIADNNDALRISPNYAPAYNGRGLAYYRKGEIEKTIADMERVLQYTSEPELRTPAAKLLDNLKAQTYPAGH